MSNLERWIKGQSIPSHVLLAGDLHGNVSLLKQRIDQTNIAFALQVGDFGVMLPSCVSKHHLALPKRMNIGDYECFVRNSEGDTKLWFAEDVLFCKGNHECFECLEQFQSNRTVHGLFYIMNATVLTYNGLRIASLGGNYSPKRSILPYGHKMLVGQHKKYRKHFCRQEVDQLLQEKEIDILITHLGPTGIGITLHSQEKKFRHVQGKDIGDAWIRELVVELQPKLHIFGHYHTRYDVMLSNTRVIGLPRIEDGYGLLDVTDWSITFHD